MNNSSSLIGLAAVLPLVAIVARPAMAQRAPDAFGTCVPMSQRAGRDVGCFIITEQQVGRLDGSRHFWHVTRFETPASASAANKTAPVAGTVLDAFGSTWLLTITDSAWRPKTGQQVAVIGPLPVSPGTAYAALYMEASMTPGMKSMVHRHSGPEAWYTMSGETCLETPSGTQVGKAGRPVIVPGGAPMELTATGTTIRKSLVLILHDASRPPTTMESTWKPRALCSRSGSP
jgi:quercetin dioxygenase-like cupin family protein